MTELLRAEVQLVLLQDRIRSRGLAKLFVVDHVRVVSVVVQEQSLTTRVQANDRLLRLQVFQLDSRVFVRCGVECVLVGNAVECPAGFALFAGLQKLVGLFQQLSGALSLELPFAARLGQVRVAVVVFVTCLSDQFQVAVVITEFKALGSNHVPLNVLQRHVQFRAAELQTA